jgi:hypothetical protein
MSRSYKGIFAALAVAGLGLACVANHPPEVMDGPDAQPETVGPGGQVQMVLEVTDVDGDSMEYSWRQVPPEPAGRFSDPHSRNPTWTAPDVTTTTRFSLQVTVNDEGGGGILGTSAVLVRVP